MIPENYKTLVEKLILKTTNKQTVWSKTSSDNEFKLELNNATITTDHWEDTESYEWNVDISIFNQRGDRIDYFSCKESEKEDYILLTNLHRLAKGSYYKIEETFKNIFKELDSNNIIGIERKTQVDDDDLPF